MSQLNVNKITGTTGTTSGAPITISGDTATLGTGTTIASGVTGTLGSGVTFPAGHIINVTDDIYTAEPATNNTSFEVIDASNFAVTVSPTSSSSTFFIIVFLSGVDAGDWAQFDIYRAIEAGTTSQLSGQTYGLAGVYTALVNDSHVTYTYLDSPSTETDITYAPSAKTTNASYDWNINDSGYSSRITVFEIAG